MLHSPCYGLFKPPVLFEAMGDLRLSLFFPVYKDERTVRSVAQKALRLASSLTADYEIIIVNDGSPDRSGEIADELAAEHASIRVIHHETNRGYGSAVRTGLEACSYEHICMTDGDDEYEVEDFRKLLKLRDRYDLIITFRYKKIYSNTEDPRVVDLQQVAPIPVPNLVPRRLDRTAPGPPLGRRGHRARVDQPPSSVRNWPSRRCSKVTAWVKSASRRFHADSEPVLRHQPRTS